MIKYSLVCAVFLATTQTATADEFEPALNDYANKHILSWSTDPILLDALRAANEMTKDYDAAQIDAADLAWRAEIGSATTPTIDQVLQNPAADFLRSRITASSGIISEAFIMDAHGLNAAASGVTSDMWQGDEAKFTQSFAIGAGTIFIDDVEFDESTQTYLGQISLAISDPETGELLGAMTVGVNAEALF